MKNDVKRLVSALSFATFTSSTMIGCIAAGFFVGRWAEGRFLSSPFGKIGGLVFGALLGMYSIFKYIRDNFSDKKKEKS